MQEEELAHGKPWKEPRIETDIQKPSPWFLPGMRPICIDTNKYVRIYVNV